MFVVRMLDVVLVFLFFAHDIVGPSCNLSQDSEFGRCGTSVNRDLA